jgi:hypothetical protein
MKLNVGNNQKSSTQTQTGWQHRHTVLGLLIGASATMAIAAGTDFRQAANEHPTLGNIVWINSILQQNKARYFEGVSVPQRLIFTGIGTTGGNNHVLALSHQASKASSHAYDFLTSWQQAYDSANIIAPGQGILNDLFIDACEPDFGAASAAICNALRTGGNTFAVTVPDTMGVVLGANTDPHITAYETVFGNRTIMIYGNAPITAGTMTFDGFAASLLLAPDVEATYTLTWTSASTQILIEMAGHLSVGADNAGGTGIGWGAGTGAAAINGGPYHVKLSQLDGASLGAQDNQIKGADIIEPCCTPGACDDGIACTIDTCVEPGVQDCSTACQNTPDNSVCIDGLPCTDDACVAGVGCVFTPDDSNTCGDGLFCTGLDLCVSGACQTGAPPCNDGVACTIDACDESTDSCTNTPDDTFCDPGQLFCNGDEVCHPVLGCQPGPPVDCSYLNDQCNVGFCDETANMCVSQPTNEGQPCDDGLFCFTGEVCVAGSCVGSPNLCSDGVGCTNDFCDDVIDACVNTPNDSKCPDDGLFCNGTQTCHPTLGCQPGTNPCDASCVCNESTDSCDCGCPAIPCPPSTNECLSTVCISGSCFYPPVGAGTPCTDDGVACTIDACDGSGTCVNTPDDTACPPDTNPCTDTICHLTAGCVSINDDTNTCDDGLFCTVGDHCDGGACVASPRDCDDGVACTDDSCDETANACVNTPNVANCPVSTSPCYSYVCDAVGGCTIVYHNGLSCDDGLYCTVGEICTNGSCGGGAPRNCEDGIACTQNSCNETLDTCVTTPQDTLCDDQNQCTDDVCVVGTGCVFTRDETNVCDDLVYCNGLETCVDGECVDGPDPCEDTNPCTLCSCDEPTHECRCECEIPEITCPDDLEFECDDIGPFGDPTIVDNCSVNPGYDCTEVHTPGKLPQEETILRTCTVTNDCGNTAQCEQRIDIVDTTPPEITCPLDCTLECGVANCTAPTCDDASCECGGPYSCEDTCATCTVTVTCTVTPHSCLPGPTAGVSPPPKLTVEKTFTGSDGGTTTATGAGNTHECVQHIDIVDTRPPVLSACPAPIIDAPDCEPLTFVPPTCTDLCGTCNVTCTRSDGLPLTDPPSSPGITVTCVATDECGTASSPCEFSVTVKRCPIPTVSQWGLAILALSLMIGAKIHFGFRRVRQVS